uniref:Uncharacterized protein n=1 Tax=Neovison vison TaxID=452646 RepID=A0A8C7BS55_NEOVI
MVFKGVKKTLEAEQPSPVPPRSNQAKASCPHSKGPAAPWLKDIFFVVPLPQAISCFLQF